MMEGWKDGEARMENGAKSWMEGVMKDGWYEIDRGKVERVNQVMEEEKREWGMNGESESDR